MNKREEFYAEQLELLKRGRVTISGRTKFSCLATEAIFEILLLIHNTPSAEKRGWLIVEARTIKLLLKKTLKALKEQGRWG